MKILKKNIDELMIKVGYKSRKMHRNQQVNTLLNRWRFFEEREADILKATGESLETVLYSKYYWCSQFKKKFNELYGEDVGIDQQQYKLIEEMNQRIISVDWELIQRIEEGELD